MLECQVFTFSLLPRGAASFSQPFINHLLAESYVKIPSIVHKIAQIKNKEI